MNRTFRSFALATVLASSLSACADDPVAPKVARVDGASRTDLFGIENPLPSPFYPAYVAYFAAIGSGATMRALPSVTREKLEPYFVNDVLADVRYGSSNHIGQAMTDCYTIYFPADDRIENVIRDGQIFEDWAKSDLHWLLHELTHAEQCRSEGGRSDYADRWFGEMSVTTAGQLLTDPFSLSAKQIHDLMPMEDKAESKADRVLPFLWGLQYSEGGRDPWARLAKTARTSGEVMIGDFGPHACDGGVRRDDVFTTEGGKWLVSYCGTTAWTTLRSSSTEIGDDYGLALGDFNGDGVTDVFRASGGEWKVSYSGRSAWTPIKTSTTEMTDSYGLAFGDFNGDGITDVFRGSGGEWKVSFSGSGSWTKIKTSDTELKDARGLALGDFNGDGITDVFRGSGGEWKVSFSGSSAWTKIKTSDTELFDERGLVLGYFDDDNKVDVLRGNGTDWLVSYGGTSAWTKINNSNVVSRRLLVGNLSGDSKSDVILARASVPCSTSFWNICPLFYYYNNTAPRR